MVGTWTPLWPVLWDSVSPLHATQISGCVCITGNQPQISLNTVWMTPMCPWAPEVKDYSQQEYSFGYGWSIRMARMLAALGTVPSFKNKNRGFLKNIHEMVLCFYPWGQISLCIQKYIRISITEKKRHSRAYLVTFLPSWSRGAHCSSLAFGSWQTFWASKSRCTYRSLKPNWSWSTLICNKK